MLDDIFVRIDANFYDVVEQGEQRRQREGRDEQRTKSELKSHFEIFLKQGQHCPLFQLVIHFPTSQDAVLVPSCASIFPPF